ncbi:MAG: MBL fold metallo-hydrolase [Oscillospiraceae bacterium]|nr:MBL fold metallo-hydrolase [Oscillospiraceae bacterium]
MSLFIPLCSSSGGNAVFVGSRNAGVLIDVGCSFKRLRESLALCGTSLDAVKAVLITHEHIDHVKGLFQITKHTDIPIYATKGTLNYLSQNNQVFSNTNLYEISADSEIQNVPVDYRIKAFRTSHDASESVGFTLEKNDCKIAYCTDSGKVTPEIRENMRGADFVFLESNYQPELLQSNPRYPYYIKRRISSETGHLSNIDCAEFLTELVDFGAVRFILGHLSRENNTPALAYEKAERRLFGHGAVNGRDYTLEIAPVVSEGKVIAV